MLAILISVLFGIAAPVALLAINSSVVTSYRAAKRIRRELQELEPAGPRLLAAKVAAPLHRTARLSSQARFAAA